MRTVTYKSVVNQISGYFGEADGMSAEDKVLAGNLINTRYRGALEYFFWPELTLIEQRQFRPSWAVGTTYAASTATAAVERYYVPAQRYYQCLVAGTGNLPATGAGFTENSAFWAECQGSYSGPDWATGSVLAVGNIVRNPDDNRFYQTITAHTAGGTIDLTKFGILTPFVRSLGYEQAGETAFGDIKKVWDQDPDANFNARPISFVLRGSYVLVRGCETVVWVEFRVRPNRFSGANWAAGSFAVGDQVYYDTTGEYYRCVATATSEAPTDATKWEKLDVPYIFAEYLAQSVYGAMVAKEDEMPEDFTVEQTAGFPLLLQEIQKIERQQGQTRQLNVINSRSI